MELPRKTKHNLGRIVVTRIIKYETNGGVGIFLGRFRLLNILHWSMCTNNITVCISNLTDATSLVDMNEHRPEKYSLNHLLDWPLLNTNSFRKPAHRNYFEP